MSCTTKKCDTELVLVLQRLRQCQAVKKNDTTPAEASTLGLLTIYYVKGITATPGYCCWTIENGGPSTDSIGMDRRIMPGTYYLESVETTVPLPREYPGRGWLLTKTSDAGFAKRRILIHAGNYPQDTRGCILPQSNYDLTQNPGYGAGSMRATKAVYDALQAYINSEGYTGNPIKILIREEHAAAPLGVV